MSLPEAQRLALKPGVDLGVNRAEHRLFDRSADDHIAMPAEQCDRRAAQRLGQSRAERGVAYSMSVAWPPVSLISNTGTPTPRNPPRWKIGRSATPTTPNGITAGEWLCTTACTVG